LKSNRIQDLFKDLTHALATPKLSLENIRNIKVPKIEKNVQEEIVAEILPLEDEIAKLQKEIDEIPAKKQVILDKYLK
ncbi:MAG: hypothetical protein SPJ08_00205, partial [Sphaerochaetaceae bacterium]|nr:hypothetical protein [Spirochaetales bacterium]MDY5967419.1 hypothetical protein [Sphaerochaetaceae bacterium]